MARAPDRQRWRQIDAILDEALELQGPERQQVLDQACGDDLQLRQEIDALLRASEQELTLPGLSTAVAAALGTDELAPGEKIGPYLLLRRVGRGGMGDVFEAVDSRLGRRVAIKRLVGSGEQSRGEERFLQEARAASALDHPNICTLHDVGRTAAGDPYLVMAFYSGKTLEARLIQGPLPLDEVRDLALQIGRGLECAHQAGIVHRDVKPANIVVTERGAAKILDFGIARMRGATHLTETGSSLGTPAYMSPEQARGEPVDERTDIWGLGLVLYEMLTGAKPFPGEHPQAVMHAILHQEPMPVRQRCPEVPIELEQVVTRALARDPERRYASIGEMLADLESAPRPAASSVGRWRKVLFSVCAVVLVVGIAGWWATVDRSQESSAAVRDASSTDGMVDSAPRRLAVFRFENLSRDPEIDWLAGGIAELLLTSLSQSSQLEVLSSGRLNAVLGELDRGSGTPSRASSLEQVRAASQRGDFDAAILGSFARAGGSLRIVMNLTSASDGEILKATQVDGGDADLFAMIDQLGATVRRAVESQPIGSTLRVQEITTPSIEAWRFYTEALALDRRGKRPEAIALLDAAVDEDPTFALAWAALGKLHKNLGRLAEARTFTERAVENADRLPPRQRYEVVGAFHATRWSTLGLALEAYQEAVRLRPDQETPRNNLAKIYTDLEHYAEAVREYRTLIDGGTEYLGTFVALANAYAGLGQFETGDRLLADLEEDRADDWLWHLHLGWHLTEWGRLEEALTRIDEASLRRPGDFFVSYTRWRALVLLDRWPEATLEAQQMQASGKPFERWRGEVSKARLDTLHGRSQSALGALDAAIRAWPEPEAFAALARCWKAELLLARDEPSAALAEARRAMKEGEGEWPELYARFWAALAEQRLGQPAAADALLVELQEQLSRQSNPVEERQIHHLQGLLAEARGDYTGALEALHRAAALLPPQGVEFHWHVYPQHVPIWVALGRVELSMGRPTEATGWFEKAVTSGAERLESPLAYVRGLYLLGESQRHLGHEQEAHRGFQRFLDHWQEGELDRGSVERARHFQ